MPHSTSRFLSRSARARRRGEKSHSRSRHSRSLSPRGSKYILLLSKISEAGGRKSEPSPTERRNPSSTQISVAPSRAAASASPAGRREAQPAIAPFPPPRCARAASSAAAVVRRKPAHQPPSARNRQSAAVSRTTCRRIPQCGGWQSRSGANRREVASASSKGIAALRNGSRQRVATRQMPAKISSTERRKL